MTLLSVRHVTRYTYKIPVRFGDHRLMFRPRDSFDQRLIDFRLDITPRPMAVRWLHDVFGNCVALAQFGGESDELVFDTNIVLDHEPTHAPDFTLETFAQSYPFDYASEEMPDLARLIERQYPDPDRRVDAWARQLMPRGRRLKTGRLLMTLTTAIKEGFVYVSRPERGTQDPAYTLVTRRGSCRDFALLMMEAARALGFAARFVTGYLHIPIEARDGIKGGGHTHAWCQVYLPGAGWVEFDPTNGIVGNRNLIRVGVARDPRQALPLSGSFIGEAADALDMTVSVETREIAAQSMAGDFGFMRPALVSTR
jgi:transglutaminase-like putative cysteine protease